MLISLKAEFVAQGNQLMYCVVIPETRKTALGIVHTMKKEQPLRDRRMFQPQRAKNETA